MLVVFDDLWKKMEILRLSSSEKRKCHWLIVMKQGDHLTEGNCNETSSLGNPNGDRVSLIEVTVEERSNLQKMWEATIGKLIGDCLIQVWLYLQVPVVWSTEGPVEGEDVEPDFRVQSNWSVLSWVQVQRLLSKLQLMPTFASNYKRVFFHKLSNI